VNNEYAITRSNFKSGATVKRTFPNRSENLREGGETEKRSKNEKNHPNTYDGKTSLRRNLPSGKNSPGVSSSEKLQGGMSMENVRHPSSENFLRKTENQIV